MIEVSLGGAGSRSGLLPRRDVRYHASPTPAGERSGDTNPSSLHEQGLADVRLRTSSICEPCGGEKRFPFLRASFFPLLICVFHSLSSCHMLSPHLPAEASPSSGGVSLPR